MNLSLIGSIILAIATMAIIGACLLMLIPRRSAREQGKQTANHYCKRTADHHHQPGQSHSLFQHVRQCRACGMWYDTYTRKP